MLGQIIFITVTFTTSFDIDRRRNCQDHVFDTGATGADTAYPVGAIFLPGHFAWTPLDWTLAKKECPKKGPMFKGNLGWFF